MQPTVQTASAWESDLVHLVDGHSQLRDAQRAHQQSVLPGLAACLKTGLEFPSAGVHHQQRHISLGRIPERNIRQAGNVTKPLIEQETSKQPVGAFLGCILHLANIKIFSGCEILILLDVTEASSVSAEAVKPLSQYKMTLAVKTVIRGHEKRTTRLENRVRQTHPSLQKHLPTPTPKTTVISNQAGRCSETRLQREKALFKRCSGMSGEGFPEKKCAKPNIL